MKHIICACFMMMGLALAGRADIFTLNETFQSGATFNGQVTFTPDDSQVTAVNGFLTGASYNGGSPEAIDWIWDPTTNFAATGGYTPGFGGNFLMSGTQPGFQDFITFTWNYSAAPELIVSTPGPILSAYGGNNIDYADPLEEGTLSAAAPEPSLYAPLLMGGIGMVYAVRRRKTSN